MKKYVILSGALALIAAAGYGFFAGEPDMDHKPQKEWVAQINLPQLNAEMELSKKIFAANCSTCHGENGIGFEAAGPPLIHKIYESSHHGDEAFQRAVAYGVQSHHWQYGNMPKIEGLTRADVGYIIQYIRAVQRENGIS